MVAATCEMLVSKSIPALTELLIMFTADVVTFSAKFRTISPAFPIISFAFAGISERQFPIVPANDLNASPILDGSCLIDVPTFSVIFATFRLVSSTKFFIGVPSGAVTSGAGVRTLALSNIDENERLARFNSASNSLIFSPMVACSLKTSADILHPLKFYNTVSQFSPEYRQ